MNPSHKNYLTGAIFTVGLFAIVSIIVLSINAVTGTTAKPKQGITKWQYEILAVYDYSPTNKEEWTKIGDDGWDVISIRRITGTSGSGYELFAKKSK